MKRLEMQTLPLLAPPGSDRACFICLEDDGDLVSCCSQCFGVAHTRCWRECRTSQRSNAIRSRMTGTSSLRDPFLCSICKTGRARMQGETVSREWMEVVLSAVLMRSRRGRDEPEEQLDMFEDMDDQTLRLCCTRKCAILNTAFFTLILLITTSLITYEYFSPSSVILYATLLLMQFLVAQVTYLIARYRRTWREGHRPVNALIDQELAERRGRLFPSDLVVVP